MSGYRKSHVVVATACILILLVAIFALQQAQSGPTLQSIRAAIRNQDFESAIRKCRERLSDNSDDHQSAILGAEAAEQAGQINLAIEFLDQIPPHLNQQDLYRGWVTKGRLQMQTGRVSDAVTTLRTVLKNRPDDTGTRRQLAHIYSGCGFAIEAVRLLRRNLAVSDMNRNDLVCLARNGDLLYGREKLEYLHSVDPSDPMPVIGLVRQAEHRNDYADIRHLLTQPDADHPAIQREQFRLQLAAGTSLQSAIDSRQFVRDVIQQATPDPGDLRTAAMLVSSQNTTLSRHLLCQALLADPWNADLVHSLSEIFRAAGHNDVAQQLLTLWQQLVAINRLALQVLSDSAGTDAIEQLANRLIGINRTAEATAWAREALRHNSQLTWATNLIRRYSDVTPRLNRDSATVMLLPKSFLQPVVFDAATTELRPLSTHSRSDTAFAFAECAGETGIEFLYDTGRRPADVGAKMHQWTGGGIGVVDIDGDTFPDLYLSQGGALYGSVASDQVYRNIRGRHFDNTTRQACIYETGFGQGVAVGDINNDGFADICVANIGNNRLLLNQGDGTFIPAVLPDNAAWTTCIAIADLNNDGNPDLYDTNYVRGQNVFEQTCDHAGLPRVCGPLDFDAEPDCILMSDGHGRFSDASVLLKKVTNNSRGMGVLVGRLSESPDVEIYIANDETENQLLKLRSDETIDEIGLARGLAVSHIGQAQGSMGVACADIDRNGLPDLFVTNYYGEHNTLYRQLQAGVSIDATSSSGLDTAGFAMLGFGCQFSDVDCDGDPDLFVANGHLDDFTHLNHPYRMRPQLFENRSDGQFSEVVFESGCFAEPQLGRAVATTDWNADGRPDFIMGTLDGPVRLISNATPPLRSMVRVRLVGTAAARQAVGATAELQTATERQRQWLTAGDGYQCSCDKVLPFAVPDNAVATLNVTWPYTAAPDEFKLPSHRSANIVVVQGRAQAYEIP